MQMLPVFSEEWNKQRGEKKKRMFFLEIVGIYIYILLSFKEAQSVLLASDNSGLYLSPYLWLFHF